MWCVDVLVEGVACVVRLYIGGCWADMNVMYFDWVLHLLFTRSVVFVCNAQVCKVLGFGGCGGGQRCEWLSAVNALIFFQLERIWSGVVCAVHMTCSFSYSASL